MAKGTTIELTVEKGYCTGCGTCVAFCPSSAIEMIRNVSKGIYLPRLDSEKCNKCGICYQVCPGHFVDFNQLGQVVFGKTSEDVLLGNYLKSYIGHAADYDIRYNSASGGMITALLIFALEERLIDGALITRMSGRNPLEAEPFIAKSRDEVISASKSKYCPVPVNVALKKIIHAKGRFAVVGLPCHLHGIRKAEQVSEELKEKIVLHLGIFCSHIPNFWGTELLLRRMKLKKEQVIKLTYRGEGWPGSMQICLSDGQTLLLPLLYWRFVGSDFFIPTRCLMCCDQTAELADISFGDAWLPEVSDTIGKSIIVCRTEQGDQFLQKAVAEKLVEFDQVTANDVKRSQMSSLYFKKKSLKGRLKLIQRQAPFNAHLLDSDFMDYLLSLLTYLTHLVSQNRVMRLLLEHIPRIVSLYRRVFGPIYTRKYRYLGEAAKVYSKK